MDQVPGLDRVGGPDGYTAPEHINDLLVHREGGNGRGHLGDGATVVGVVVLGDLRAVIRWDGGPVALFAGRTHGVGVDQPLDHGARHHRLELQGQSLTGAKHGRGIPNEVRSRDARRVGGVGPRRPGALRCPGEVEELGREVVGEVHVVGIGPAHVGGLKTVEDHVPGLDRRSRRHGHPAAQDLGGLLRGDQRRAGAGLKNSRLVVPLIALAERVVFVHYHTELM